MKYANPVLPGFYPDPSVCKGEDGYYLVTSSFEYLPGVPLFFSHNMIDWKQIGYCLDRPSQIDLENAPCSGGIFAPTIRYHQGTYYMITTNIGKGTFYVTSQNPALGWSDPIFLQPQIEGIDPSLFFEEEHVYVQLSSFREQGIIQFEVDMETGKIIGECKMISKGCGGRDVEAPHMYDKDGTYYLLCAEGGTRDGHMVTMQKSTSLWGPFVPCPHPIVTNRDHGREALQGVGHGDLIQDEQGAYWMVCLGYRPVKHKHVLGRETLVLPVEWKDTWPMVAQGYAQTSIVTIEERERDIIYNIKHHDFDDDKLPIEFNSMRTFLTKYYTLEERPGYLRLKAASTSLDEAKEMTFLGRRQQHHKFVCTACFDLEQLQHGEGGLSIYMDTSHHVELAIQAKGDFYEIVMKKRVGEILHIESPIAIQEKRIYLCIQGNPQTYDCFFGTCEETMQQLGFTRCAHVSTEVADSPFTGVYLGMYAIDQAIIDVDWFAYEEVE